MNKKKQIFTIGHSTKTLNEFLEILIKYNINIVVDIRKIPKSRYNSQFNTYELKNFLTNHNIRYKHEKDLTGLRKPIPNSINTGWINKSFQGFADYMQTKKLKKQ